MASIPDALWDMCKLSILDWFSGSQWEETDYASDQHEQSEEHCSAAENDDEKRSNNMEQKQWQDGVSDSKIDDETLEEENRVQYEDLHGVECSDGDKNSHEGEDYDAEDEDTDESDVGDDTESKVDSDKDVAVSETASDNDDVVAESDSDKDVAELETGDDKADAESETVSDKDDVVSETDSDKDVAELETGNGKADSESVTVSDKDDAESETVSDKDDVVSESGSDNDVAESETVSDSNVLVTNRLRLDNDVAESETVSDKDVAESKRGSDKDDAVSETGSDTNVVESETVSNKIDEQLDTVRAEEETLNVHAFSDAALAKIDKRREENQAQNKSQTEGQSCIDSDTNVVVDETADKGGNEGFDEAQRHLSDNPKRDVVQAPDDRINSNMDGRKQEEASGNLSLLEQSASTETKSEEECVRHGSQIQPQLSEASPTNRPQAKSEEECVTDDNLIDISMNESPPEIQSNMIHHDAIAKMQKTSQPELSLESIPLYKRKQLYFASIISKSKLNVVCSCINDPLRQLRSF